MNIHLYPSTFTNESRILRESHSLKAKGVFARIELVGMGGEGLQPVETLPSGIIIRRLGHRGDPVSLLEKVTAVLSWAWLVLKHYRREPIECVNCHSVSTLPLCVILKLRSGATLVYDAHELETETNGLNGIRKSVTKLVERALIGWTDASIFVGESIRDWYATEYGLENIGIVYNCPNRTEMPSSDYFREHYGIDQATRIFLYQGLLAPGRGLEILISAFSRLQGDAVLIIMGYGPLEAWVGEQAEAGKNIFCHEAVPPGRLLVYTAAADCGLSIIEPTSLSYEYCMPNKLFEYLMAGIPVIVSSTVEQKAFVIREGVGVVADECSSDGVLRAVSAFLNVNEGAFAEQVARAREKYSWEAQEQELLGIYSRLGFVTTGATEEAG